MHKGTIIFVISGFISLLILSGCGANPTIAVQPTNTSTPIPPTLTNTPKPTPTRSLPTATLDPNDNFNDNSVNRQLWNAEPWGVGPQIEESNNKIEINLPADSTKVTVGNELNFGAGYFSRFRLSGDFDIEIEFQIIKWPRNNGVSVSLAVYPGGSVERAKWGGTSESGLYITNYFESAPGTIFDIAGETATKDLWGKLRLTRIADELTGYFFQSGKWVAVRKGKVDTQPVEVHIVAFNHGDYNDNSSSNDIQVEFDNFIINKGDVIWR